MKKCSKCGQMKSVDDFGRDPRVRSGRQAACRACYAAKSKRFSATRPGMRREYNQRYMALNRERENQRSRDYRLANIDRLRAQAKERYLHADPEARREYLRKWRAANAAKVKESGRLYARTTAHGLTGEEFDALLSAQNGCCAICIKPLEAWGKDTHIDHDHSCCPGARHCRECVRGILCSHCNNGLGHFRDSPEIMEAAAGYVRRYRSR